jgi:DNA repair exonuclease SbcCD ATPase subunit
MAYLITHIAICLVFAQLMGLLLGWLLWGYVARQRGKELQTLRESLADAQLMAPRLQNGDAPEPARSLSEASALPESPSPGQIPQQAQTSLAKLPDDDIPTEAEALKARIQQLEQQIKELEGFRHRLPALQIELNDALAGRKATEGRFQQARADFELRAANLQAQIEDLERQRDEFERLYRAKDKELEAARAQALELQNAQQPRPADPQPGVASASALELADWQSRHQKVWQERNALAAELESYKQRDLDRPDHTTRIAELQAALQSKESGLQEQIARIESLLWRVAELEPFEAATLKLEEDVRRQASEIAGHLAMHADNAEHIAELLKRNAELEAAQQAADELHKELASKDEQIAAHLQFQTSQLKLIQDLQAQISRLEDVIQRAASLQKLLADRDAEIRALLSAHSDTRLEMQNWQSQAARLPQLEAILSQRDVELQRLQEANYDKDGQLMFLQERLNALSGRLAAQQQRLLQLEPLATQEDAARNQLQALEERHQADITRVKVNSAQRLRRLRQSIAAFRV